VRIRIYQMKYVRQLWTDSSAYRRILVAALVYVLLRLVVQGVFLGGMLLPGQMAEETLPDDLRIYLEAADDLRQHQDLYPEIVYRWEFYQYAPAYALAFTPFLWLPVGITVVVHTLLHIVVYGLLYVWWGRIFHRLGLERAVEMLARFLPLWLIFPTFWTDLGYLNIYILMALLSTLLIDAVLHERLGWSVLWLAIIIQIKPQWAFAAAVPLFLGRYRFFFKLLTLGIVTYLAVMGVTMVFTGPSYGWQQYKYYFSLLTNLLGRQYPWRTLADGFLGYNHSITQSIVYLFGVSSGTLRLATLVKVIFLVPLGIVAIRCLRQPARRSGDKMPRLALDLAFVLYTAAFLWLDAVWELSLSIVIFTYFLATMEQRWARTATWIIFLPYALLDIWRLLSLIVFGPSILIPGPYILTDPNIYIPLVMIVTLAFYALLVWRLWTGSYYKVRGVELDYGY
jgi:hypothetical protein